MEYVYLGFLITAIPLFFILISGKFDIFSPPSLHVVSWFLVFASGLMVGKEFYSLTFENFMLFGIWYLVVGSIFFVVYFYSSANKINKNIYEIKYKNFLLILVFMSCLITVSEILKVGYGGPYNFFLNLRLSLFVEDYTGPRYFLTPILYIFLTPLFAISLLCKNAKHLFYILVFWQILYVISTMGKFTILTPLLIYIVVYYLGNNIKIKILNIILLCIILSVTFLSVNLVRSSDDADSQKILEVIGIYVYSPLLALGNIQLCDNCNFGEYTFRFFYALFYKLGLSSIPPVNTVLEYQYLPFPTNVYTVIQPFYFDFGVYGVFYGALIYGLIYSLIYLKARQGNKYFLVIYALISVSLITSFFGETLITNFALSLYLVFISLLIWKGLVYAKR